MPPKAMPKPVKAVIPTDSKKSKSEDVFSASSKTILACAALSDPISGEESNTLYTSTDKQAIPEDEPHLIINGTYLYLPDKPLGDTNPNYIISMAPLNSSGDIYHILSYIILARTHNKKIPNILLTFDAEKNDEANPGSAINTADQVLRSMNFAKTLGLGSYFSESIRLNTTNSREAGRQDALHRHFKKKEETVYYIDQMATTTFLALHVKQFGYSKTTDYLFAGYSHRKLEHFPKQAQTVVDQYINEEYKKITQIQNRETPQPLIILHIRNSSKANEKQDLPGNFLQNFIQYLQDKDHLVWVILANGNKIGLPKYKSAEGQSQPFSEKKGMRFVIDDIDYAKQAHLQLLLKLKQDGNVKAVIGNTSGTLDLAAFLGFCVYSIHQFTGAKIEYQECRLYLQLMFLTVAELVKTQDPKNPHELTEESKFDDWLNTPRIGMGKKIFTTKNMADIPEKIYNSGFCKMFFFQTWKKDADTRSFDNIVEGNGDNSGYLIDIPEAKSLLPH